MMFKSDIVKAQWDTWCYYHNGTHYLYYLIAERSPGEGFGVATSQDGVRWSDHGWAIRASDQMVDYLGTGAVWKAPDFERSRRFLCNYSEWRIEPGTAKKTQNILFAWSGDLIHWTKFGDDSMFRVDDRRYDKYGRWDCIFPMPRVEGGYWGTWTATARPQSPKGVIGIGLSEDGVKWTAMDAPQVLPGVEESGAFWRFGGRIHAMFGAGGSMWAYTAEEIAGPYRRAGKNALLLSSRWQHTYFSRFFPTPEGVLVNHHAMSGKMAETRPITYLAPLKLAAVDDEGVLRLKYWPGNQAMKGASVPLHADAKNSPAATLLTDALDAAQGAVVEGTLELPAADAPPAGLFLQVDAERYSVCVAGDGRATFTRIELPAGRDQALQAADRELRLPRTVPFRLLCRRGMVEFYLDEHLMECCTLGCPNGKELRIGVLGKAEGNAIGSLKMWRMDLAP